MNDQNNILHLVRAAYRPRPLSNTELRVAVAWYRGKVTVRDIIAGRARSARGACFALIEGARRG